jgi:hypothetical protein
LEEVEAEVEVEVEVEVEKVYVDEARRRRSVVVLAPLS